MRTLVFCLLVIVARRGGIRSAVVWIFALMSTISLVLRCISLAMHGQKSESYLDAVTILPLRCLFLFLCSIADAPPHDSEEGKEHRCSPRETASIPSYITFTWATKLALIACRKQLEILDLHELLPNDKISVIREKLSIKRRHESVKRCGKSGTSFLMGFLFRSFQWELLHQAVYRLLAALTQIAVAILLKYLISFIVDAEADAGDGYVIIILIAASSLTSNIVQHIHMDMTIRTGLRMRTTLISMIYQKSMSTVGSKGAPQQKDSKSGQQQALVNLIAVDADRVPPLIEHGHIVWACVVDFTICGFFLFQELGYCAIAGLLLLIMTIPINLIISANMKSCQKEQMHHKDDRVRHMSEILSGIKVIKMSAWEDAFLQGDP